MLKVRKEPTLEEQIAAALANVEVSSSVIYQLMGDGESEIAKLAQDAQQAAEALHDPTAVLFDAQGRFAGKGSD